MASMSARISRQCQCRWRRYSTAKASTSRTPAWRVPLASAPMVPASHHWERRMKYSAATVNIRKNASL